MKILIILLIIVIFLIITKNTFASLSNGNYTLNTPGFGNETYELPVLDLTSENIKLDETQYSVFVKYMDVPKIANFMSDNSQILNDKMDGFIGINTTGIPGIISGNTISYNQAIGTNLQTNPSLTFQLNRTNMIVSVIISLLNLYCSDTKANVDTPDKKYLTNCVFGDIIVDLETMYYVDSGQTLSLDPISLDYPTYSAIWYALHNRRIILIDRLGIYDQL
jgi:hypothetical protein